jgi:hypothetical protein
MADRNRDHMHEDRRGRDLCVGENDTCRREPDWSHSKGRPDNGELCAKHAVLKVGRR